MRQLTDCFEGLLDKDFDIPESSLSILNNCKRVQNDLYDIPRASTLKSLEKLINPDIQVPDEMDFKHNWAEDCPAVQRLLSWIASKPMSWVVNQNEGDFYIAFCNQCLTKTGSRRTWTVSVIPMGFASLNGYKDLGWKVTVRLLTGSSWSEVARLAIYKK